MRPVVVKVTSKNQITSPDVLMRELSRPSHLKAFVQEGDLVLFSARLGTFDEQAKEASVPPSVLKRAYALTAERRAATAEQRPPAMAAVERDSGSCLHSYMTGIMIGQPGMICARFWREGCDSALGSASLAPHLF